MSDKAFNVHTDVLIVIDALTAERDMLKELNLVLERQAEMNTRRLLEASININSLRAEADGLRDNYLELLKEKPPAERWHSQCRYCRCEFPE